ncbi:MAG: hypothetical protein H7039_08710 [Bryobacteraceae bacterium]|nr:hypothetical protein [Bryobacteraceae bacterium]MBC7925724.1 hypothetical protein [Bryobacteraceae bacterium]
MARSDLYIKVVIDHDEHDTPQQLAGEVCRQIEKVYGVRKVELTNYLTRDKD